MGNNILQELLKASKVWRALLDALPGADVDDFNFALEILELKGFVRYVIDGRYHAVVNEVLFLDAWRTNR